MTASKRIIVNTIASYSRSLVGIVLGLFGSRWVLQALGAVDFGLMGVVGGLIIFLSFFKNVLAASVSRFYSLSIGKAAENETKAWFNVALSIHVLFPLFLVVIGAPIGEWAIYHFVKIPSDRIATALWVFRFSLIAACFTFISTPFTAMFVAKQCIVETSAWNVALSFLNLGLAFILTQCKGDAWFFYGLWTIIIQIAIMGCQTARACIRFPECRISVPLWWNAKRMREMLAYTGWSWIGSLGQIFRGSGIAVLLNLYFPSSTYPDVNASHSIASRVGAQSQTLSTALLTAFSPEITRTEGLGNRGLVCEYALRASKFGVMLVALFAIPIMLEIEYILRVWLKTPPSYAAPLSCLTLIVFLIDKVTFGHLVAVSAVGKIAGYQLTVGISMILTLPLAWLFLALGATPIAVGWAMVITMTICSCGRLLWARSLVGVSIWLWLRQVFVPVCISIFVCSVFGYAFQCLVGNPSGLRCLSVFVLTITIWCLCVYGGVMTRDEREFLQKKAMSLVRRFKHE